MMSDYFHHIAQLNEVILSMEIMFNRKPKKAEF